MNNAIEDIPELANLYKREPVKQIKKREKKAAKSAFQILINPNVGASKFGDDENKMFINEFYRACQFYELKLSDFTKAFPGKDNFRPPKVLQTKFKLEKMPRDGRVHCHMFVQFDGLCYIDQERSEAFFHHILSRWQGKKILVSSHYIKSNQLLFDYFEKQQEEKDD